jgi:hypothetical protein
MSTSRDDNDQANLPGDGSGAEASTRQAPAPESGRRPLSSIEPPDEADGMRYLRYAAGLFYTTDLRGTTVPEMAKHPVYGAASLRTLEKWCAKDRWIERRKQNLEAWREQIARGIGNELARVRTEQLVRLQAVFELALAKLENDLVDAKSWEGVAGALVKLAEVMDTWRDKIRGDVIPGIARSLDPPAQARPQLTDEEARAAAMVIIHKRREQMRLEAARQNELDRQGKKPGLHVVDGRGKD